jgi:Na+/H+ antiporter NhaD/arsenite permease-like protein
MIVSDSRIASKIDFFTFTLHMTPAVIMSSAVSYFLIKRLSAPLLTRQPNMNKKKEVELWRKTAKKLKEENEEERIVKQKLEEHILGLEQALQVSPPSPALINLPELEAKYTIRDKKLFFNCCVILLVVIILFFLHSAINLQLSLAWIAIIGAVAILLISGVKDIDEILDKVEFSTLLFFAGLFILMRTLEEMGLIDFIGDKVSILIARVPEGQPRLAVAIILVIWISGFVSAFIDNIPYTAAMIPVVLTLGNGDLGLPLEPLIWSLAYGTCFGGNGTLLGASANVVAAGISESQGYPIRFSTFFRTGFPVMIVSLFCGMSFFYSIYVFSYLLYVDISCSHCMVLRK